MGRRLFWVLVASLIVLVLITFGQLPPVVASHFDGAGAPNGWSSRSAYTILLVSIGVLLPVGMIGFINALTQRGPQMLNIPAREYWRRPENMGEAVRRVRAYMWWLGCIMAGTACAVHWLIVEAHGNQPPRLSTAGIVFVLGAIAVAFALWMIGWYRLLRPPAIDGRG